MLVYQRVGNILTSMLRQIMTDPAVPLGKKRPLGTWRKPGGATVMRPVRALSVGPSVDAPGKTQSIPQGLAGNGWCSQHAPFRIGLPKYTSSNLMFHDVSFF